MKKWLILLVFCCSLASAEEKDIWTPVSWLAGCWTGTGKEQSLEQWMAPAGGMMLGMSRTIVAGKPTEFECMRIVETDGKLYFIAKPSGQAETRFTLIKSSSMEAVFENTHHDFPQRVIYRLQPDGSLVARIEGSANGKQQAV